MAERDKLAVLVPITVWGPGVGPLQAAGYEAGLIVLFIAYTYSFTWGFDRVFGLPVSVR